MVWTEEGEVVWTEEGEAQWSYRSISTEEVEVVQFACS